MRILLIEDDAVTADYVASGLREEGHVVDHLADGREGLVLAMEGRHDILVVDRMLPGLDGLSLLRALRAARVMTPALFLTAMGGLDDRIEGLKAGGDDYLVKPFAFGELSARIEAIARRPRTVAEETVLRAADLEMDLV
ncbi:MAG: response regulator, partial [Sphingomonadaceae bacterium]